MVDGSGAWAPEGRVFGEHIMKFGRSKVVVGADHPPA